MRITIDRSLIKTVTQNIKRAVPRSRTLPVLNFVRCARDPRSGVTLTATDIERTIRHRLPQSSWDGEDGAFLVSLDDLSRAAKGSGASTPVTLEAQGEDTVAVITQIAGHSVRRLAASYPAAEFPPCEIPAMDMTAMDAQAFLSAYRLAAPYVSRDDTRGVLQGIYLEAKANKLVATDGRRLTAVDLPMVSLTENAVLPVVPLLTGRLDIEGEILVGIAKNEERTVVRLDAANWSLVAPCIEGTYPNYRQVIPAARGDEATVFDFSDVPAGVLGEALSQFAGDADDMDMVVLYGDPERVVLVGGRPEEGKPRLKVPLAGARCQTARWIAVGVNRGFFDEPVRQGFTRIEVADERSPLRLTGDLAGVHILMPMHGGDLGEVREAVTGRPEPEAVEPAAQASGSDAHDPATQDPEEPVQEPVAADAPETVNEEAPDPREAFRAALQEVNAAVRGATDAVKMLRQAARDIERHHREQIKAAAARKTRTVRFRSAPGKETGRAAS